MQASILPDRMEPCGCRKEIKTISQAKSVPRKSANNQNDSKGLKCKKIYAKDFFSTRIGFKTFITFCTLSKLKSERRLKHHKKIVTRSEENGNMAF